MPDGSTIGKYKLEAELGRGGFGRVYKAFDPIVGRPVAIKVLTALDRPDLLARFRSEARATGNLRHANIVTIYDFAEQDGVPYIVMEYLEGQDLKQFMAAEQPLSLLEKVRIMAQVGQGLQHAHANGVVHRDVKPANIRVLPGGSVKVMDFGIARLANEIGKRHTQRGQVIGTFLYMSPEQLRGADADPLCDIFAYGSVFYELLSGKYPFQAENTSAIMFKIVSEQPAPLSEVAPGCPEALELIVMRALAKERELRYQSFTDLLFDLDAVLLDLQKARAAELLTEARALLNSGQTVEAQAFVRNILDLDPANGEARLLRQRVEESLRKMSARSRIEAILNAAEGQITKRQFHEAIASLESALKLDADDPDVVKFLARARGLQEQESRARMTQSGSGLEADRTLLVDPKITDLPPPAQESAVDLPQDFTTFFGKTEAGEPLNAYVTILSCPDSFREGQTVPVQSSPFRIGRSEGDLLISEDMTLSRLHASISRNSSGFSIQDLGSPNGTYLNGRRLSPNQDALLPLNAEIRLSTTTRLRFRCDVSELPDFTGQKLAGRYSLEKCLRAGRKSAFYEGADSRPVRKVAVKLLSPTLASYPGYLDQFEREAQTAAELDHPNICRIYEHGSAPLSFSPGETKSVHYLCMQMLDGGSLAQRLD
jgi:serine/threonine protein kinase